MDGATHFLADKSALARLRFREVDAVMAPLLRSKAVGICGVTQLEVLYSARGYNDLTEVRMELAAVYEIVPTLQADFDRALDIIQALARRGQHRSVGTQDLIIAAVAERAGLTLLHYDSDYDHIAGITGQPVQWVVPRGTVP